MDWRLNKTALVSLVVVCSAAAMHGQSALDGFDPNANGTINAVVVQPDGKILLGGDFTTLSPNGGVAVPRNYIARVNPDGTLDTAFNPNASGSVSSIAVQADGKVLVGGLFQSIGGQPRRCFARLDGLTGLADSFDPNPNAIISSIVVQADGKILVAGAFDTIGGQTRNRIARLDPATSLADSFNPNANNNVLSIAVQADGKVLAGGLFTNIGGQPRNRIARLDATTGAADSFDPNANSTVFSIAVQADGKILVGGYLTSVSGLRRNFIARLDATTGAADSFDPNANGQVRSIAVQADGKILAGGAFQSIGGQALSNIARLDATTGSADSFNPNADSTVYSIAAQADGKILVGGFFTEFAPNGGPTVTRNRIARLEVDGRLDQTLSLNIVVPTPSPTPSSAPIKQIRHASGAVQPDASSYIFATAVQPNGKILIGGQFSNVLGLPRSNIARLNTDGTLDIDFNPNANGNVWSITIQADGKILAAGHFTTIGGQTRNNIARLDATTGLADSFDPDANAGVDAIALQTDGKILVGGEFSIIGGQLRQFIARLDATTGLADSFNPNPNSYGVWSIAVQADGKVLVGGHFSMIGGQTRNRIARLDATTGLADSFNPNADFDVFSIALQADGKILVGGNLHTIGGQTRYHIARLDATTGLADSFDPSANDVVYSIAVQGNGKVLACGNFTSIGGHSRNHISRLDPITGLADSFDANAIGFVDSIAVQSDGKVLVGGNFTSIGGQSRNLFARLSNDSPALQNLAIVQNAITWSRGGSSPQFTRVTFDYSSDNMNYSPLGNGTVSGNDWTLTGLSLPIGENFYIRASGYYRSGFWNGSESITELVRNAFLTGPTGTPSATPTGTPTPTAIPSPTAAARALNLSTRMLIQTGDSVGIGGLIITGSGPKRVFLRAIGPSLSQFGVPNPLADPVLELHGPPGFETIINDNWGEGNPCGDIQICTICPQNPLESMICATLDPGAYTAIVRGNNGSGVGLIEVYDLDTTPVSKLANISTRAFVSTGSDIMIAGFILGGGSEAPNMILRGIGPSLSDLGVPNALADPTLELRDDNGALLRANDNWMDDPQQAEILTAAGLALSDPNESGIAATLAPGQYTALVAGVDGDVGNGLVEAYDLGYSCPCPTPGPTATPTATVGASPSPSGPCVENWDSVTAPALPAGWVASNPDPGDGTMWATTTTMSESPPNNIFLFDQDGISDKVLDRTGVNVTSANATLSFRNNFNMDFSSGTYWDGYWLEVSAPNISGGEFLDITDSRVGGSFVSGGYTGEICCGTCLPPIPAERMAWSSNSGGYIDTVISLGPNLAGQTVTFRFRMCTNEAVGAPGVHIDNLVFTDAVCP